MAHATTTTRLETLSCDNYDTWCIQAGASLVKNDTWGYISGEIVKPVEQGEGADLAQSQASIKTWTANDRKADLILAINPPELAQIRGCTTSREVWLKLDSVYASKGPAQKAALLKHLTQQKMQNEDDDKLQAMDIDINGDLLTIMLLYSLPNSLEHFHCAIESRDDLQTWNSWKWKL